jgi:hypothetical protein
MNSLQSIFDLLHALWGLPGYALVYLSCIAFGYLCKAGNLVPNDKIPLFLFLWGTIWNLLLADTRSPGSSLRLWVARNLIIGFIIAALAWLTHNRWLKLWLDPKFPSLSPANPPSDKPTITNT